MYPFRDLPPFCGQRIERETIEAMSPLPDAFGKLLLSLSLASGAPAATDSVAQTTCTYDEPSKTVTVVAPDRPDGALVVLTVESGVILFQEFDFQTGDVTPKAPCGAATTANTDLVRAQGGGLGGLTLVVDQTTGPFAPGATAESTGVAEIEFDFQPTGLIGFIEPTVPGVVRLGTLGANLNGDDDVDVTFLSAEAAFGYAGSGGVDDIAATGGLATGDPTTRFLSAFGLGGNDLLTAGLGAAELNGMGGSDIITGGPGPDGLIGGPGGDRISAAAGSDFVAGSSGNDVLLGGAGRDFLDGGAGKDRCVGGPGKDRENKCER